MLASLRYVKKGKTKKKFKKGTLTGSCSLVS